MRRTGVRSAVVAFAVLAAAMWLPSGGASPVSDPIVSPEYSVADLATRDAPYDQTMPSIASDGNNYLVVWTDGRGDNGDVYGARVAPDGTVLDVGGIPISTAPNQQLSPDVAFDGTNYLVTWSDSRSNFDRYDVYAARVTPAGTVLDPGGIPVSTETFDQESPRLAFDGTNYLIVWTDGRLWPDPGEVLGARVSPSGTVLDPQGFFVSTASNGQYAGGIAFDGTNYLVSWTDLRNGPPDVYAARVTPSATVIDPTGIPVSTASSGQYASGVAFDGTNYLVVWGDGRSGLDDVYAARVTSGGTVLDATGIPISTASSHQSSPRVAFDGTNYLVAWTDARTSAWDLYGARVTPAGGVLDPNGIKISEANNTQWRPAVGSDGTNFLVVWDDDRVSEDPYNWETYGARVTGDGAVLEPDGIALSITHASQPYPAIAFDGANYLVVWQDDRSGRGAGEAHDDIYAARVTQDGARLDGTGIAIATAPSVQAFPSVAFDGTNYLVVWSDYRQPLDADIYGARVTPAGQVLDPDGFLISDGPGFQFTPVVAFDGTNYMVTWTDTRSDDGDVYAARVSPEGTVLDPAGIPVSAEANGQGPGGITFADGMYFIVCSDARAAQYRSDVYGVRVTPSGDVLDPDGIPISTAPDDEYPSGVAFDGSNFLVAWSVDLNDAADNVYAARVSPAGSVLDPNGIPVSVAAGSQGAPTVAFADGSFLLIWSDSRGGGDDLYAARVDGSGTVLDPGGLFVAAAVGDFVRPRAVSSTGGRVAVAYHRRVATAPPTGTTRSFLRFLDPGLPPPPPPPPPPPAPPPPPPPPPPPQPPPPPPPPPTPRCRVPRLIGLRLGVAKTRIRSANCSLGRVRRLRVRARRIGRVLAQSPRAGTTGRRGLRVDLVVGRR